MRLFIIGIGGFIGSSLVERILNHKPDWFVSGLDPNLDRLEPYGSHERLTAVSGTMASHAAWLEDQIKESDVVLPLAAIADPKLYVQDPLRVFELDFEANLAIVRLCVRHQKRLVFPSTSEVYGMSDDIPFDEDTTNLVQGPIHKERWIYSASKQLLDRVIYAYGKHEGLHYTLFRPFNWIGPYLDHVDLEHGGRGRVLVQFLGQIFRGQPLRVSGDGAQRRCFTDIDDALDALIAILENPGKAAGRIFNIGHPGNEYSVADFAKKLLEIVCAHPEAPACVAGSNIIFEQPESVFGAGYQDVLRRVPSIEKTKRLLDWAPKVSLDTSLKKITHFHIRRLFGISEKRPMQERARG
jgi:nucleoside-diphosphate-sugar epimerase